MTSSAYWANELLRTAALFLAAYLLGLWVRCTHRRYTRSLEGFLALAIIPLAMMLAEAWSPHTWDGPLLYAAGGASTVATLELSRLCEF